MWGSGALREMLSQIPFALLTFAAMLEDKGLSVDISRSLEDLRKSTLSLGLDTSRL